MRSVDASSIFVCMGREAFGGFGDPKQGESGVGNRGQKDMKHASGESMEIHF